MDQSWTPVRDTLLTRIPILLDKLYYAVQKYNSSQLFLLAKELLEYIKAFPITEETTLFRIIALKVTLKHKLQETQEKQLISIELQDNLPREDGQHEDTVSYLMNTFRDNWGNNEIPPETFRAISEPVKNFIRHATIYPSTDRLKAAIENLQDPLGEKSFEEIYHNIVTNSRKVVAMDEHTKTEGLDTLLDTSSQFLADQILQTQETMQEQRILVTGLQRLNLLLDYRGGLPPSKLIIFCAIEGNFKSTLLLYIAQSVCKYNQKRVEDLTAQNLVPVWIHWSCENSNTEDVERLVIMRTGKSILKLKMQKEKLSEMFAKDAIRLKIINESGKYFTPHDMEIAIQRLALQGQVVVGITVDYLKYINPNQRIIVKR